MSELSSRLKEAYFDRFKNDGAKFSETDVFNLCNQLELIEWQRDSLLYMLGLTERIEVLNCVE